MQTVFWRWFGEWRVDIRLACYPASWALGLSADLRSWRRLYPWLATGIWIGPFTVQVEAIRPGEYLTDIQRRQRLEGHGRRTSGKGVQP